MARVWHLTCEACGKNFEHTHERGRLPNRCDECREKDPKGRDPDYRKRRERAAERFGGRLSEFDVGELSFIMNKTGMSQADAVRTCIRVYAALLRSNRL